MLQSPAARTHADLSALEARAVRAGSALACAYSSSAEFDAALIAARRAAGIYGPRRRRRLMAVAAGIAAALTGLMLLFI
jgi:hypothetical protein